MDEGRASTTAMGTALMRATHTRLDRPVLIDDPWGERLVPEHERAEMLERAGVDDLDPILRAHPSYGTVILRAHYAERQLQRAVADGVGQYVIIGAGLDSFALRALPFASALEIFEIDHPSTQTLKRERLAACGASLPANLHLIAADLSETSLADALASAPFDSEQRAFLSWLGVTTYLSREANMATFAAIAACTAPGSEVVFSYAEQHVLDGDDELLVRAREHVASVGEPWVSGFDPELLGELLHGVGLELVEDLGQAELNARFCAERSDGLSASRSSHVARARVLG